MSKKELLQAKMKAEKQALKGLRDWLDALEKLEDAENQFPSPEEIREKLGAAADTISSQEREAEPKAKEGVVWSFRYPASEKKSLAEQVARPGFKSLILPLGHSSLVSVGVKKEEGVAILCASVNGAGTTLQLTTLQLRELKEMLQAVDTLLTYPPIPQDVPLMHPMEFE